MEAELVKAANEAVSQMRAAEDRARTVEGKLEELRSREEQLSDRLGELLATGDEAAESDKLRDERRRVRDRIEDLERALPKVQEIVRTRQLKARATRLELRKAAAQDVGEEARQELSSLFDLAEQLMGQRDRFMKAKAEYSKAVRQAERTRRNLAEVDETVDLRQHMGLSPSDPEAANGAARAGWRKTALADVAKWQHKKKARGEE